MAGHLGAEKVTVQNLEVFGVDADRGLILVKGGVPGAKGSYVRIVDAVKAGRPAEAPYPAAYLSRPDAPRRRPRPRRRRLPRHRPRPTPRRRPGSRMMQHRRQESRRRGGGRGRARRRRVRRRGPHRHPPPRRAVAAGQAPGRHPQGQDPRRDLPHRRQDVQAEGHRPRAARLARASTCSAAAASPSARSRATTPTTCRRRSARWACAARCRARRRRASSLVLDEARLDEPKTKALRAAFGRLGLDARR